jgi:L-threonylcarbamoyladenylate synthase
MAARHLARAGLVAFPTETVYGLGADALSDVAVAKVFQAKGRPVDHPLIVHVATTAAARALSRDWPAAAQCLADAFWPGPLTLIVPRADVIPLAVTGGQEAVGLRVPSHPVAQSLLTGFAAQGSGAVAAPSANRFGQVSATRAADVMAQLAARLAADDLVLDGGPCTEGLESTVVDCTAEVPRILRPGVIGRTAVAAVLSAQGIGLAGAAPDLPSPPVPRVSGSLASHYAPRTPLCVLPAETLRLRLVEYLRDQPGASVAVWLLSPWPDAPGGVHIEQAPKDATAYGRALYARLNDWDTQGFALLGFERPPQTPDWEAVHDRLRRAAF